MTDYKAMYLLLFNAVTDALEKMDRQNYGEASALLIAAQQKAGRAPYRANRAFPARRAALWSCRGLSRRGQLWCPGQSWSRGRRALSGPSAWSYRDRRVWRDPSA